jgi:hypothetical protein
VGRKFSAFVACLAVTLLLVVPGAMAAITVTDITPSSGQTGATVDCTVTGTFHAPVAENDIDAPAFTLNNGVGTPIAGTTDAASVTATSANVSFVLPPGVPAAGYALEASQLYHIWIIAFTDTASLPNAFQLVPTVPAISSLSPGIAKGGADLTLTVNGGDFVDSSPGVDGSSVSWNGEALATTFNSATRLTAIVPAAKLTTSGGAEVTVMNVTAGTTSAPKIFTVDTTKPSTDAINAVSVKRNKTARLKLRISEPAGLSPSAKVVVKIKAAKGGKTVKTITLKNVRMNTVTTYTFKVTMKKGSYRWYVYATDLAGNAQANVDKASFKVK